mgnify:CR=1 FL=1
MVVKRFILIVCILVTGNLVKAQVNVESQFGGTAIFGVLLRTEPLLLLDEAKLHRIGISLGVGSSFGDGISTMTGLHYYFKGFGIGADASAFHRFSLTGLPITPRFRFAFYPNLNYKIPLKNHNQYIKFTAGPMFFYDRRIRGNSVDFVYEGVMPGVGVSWGEFFYNER